MTLSSEGHIVRRPLASGAALWASNEGLPKAWVQPSPPPPPQHRPPRVNFTCAVANVLTFVDKNTKESFDLSLAALHPKQAALRRLSAPFDFSLAHSHKYHVH